MAVRLVRHLALALAAACATTTPPPTHTRAVRAALATDSAYVAYGAQPRRDLAVAAASVVVDVRASRGTRRFEELLDGRVAGVEVLRRGAGYDVLVRGRAPLFVVDGVPLPAGSRASDLLRDIDPRDVERVDVLKDAGATAAYGVRGGGGVILITLRKR
jgi:TonB-dependent SusC/RagA subfamily outer membrane receptor